MNKARFCGEGYCQPQPKEKPLSLEEVYEIADRVAKINNQTVGIKNNFYITLEQLMEIIS